MRSAVMSVHPGLAGASRLPAIRQEDHPLQWAEALVLLGAGVTAALASVLLDFSLRVPGHAIIRVVLPMAFGLAVAPRRMAGAAMGATALGSALVIKVGGFATVGVGAMASLALAGPLLDLALWRARRGWGLYLGFALAGLGANLAALGVRVGAKLVGLEHVAARPLGTWLPQAAVTYPVCGALAGLLSALLWFQFSTRGRDAASPESPP